MSKSIPLSMKHGVNPTITVCFWCGEDDGVALLGKLPGDAEAPKRMVADFEPCSKCAEKMETGFTIMEATSSPNDVCRVEMQSGVYPTGRWAVISLESVNSEVSAKTKKAFMTPDAFDSVVGGD